MLSKANYTSPAVLHTSSPHSSGTLSASGNMCACTFLARLLFWYDLHLSLFLSLARLASPRVAFPWHYRDEHSQQPGRRKFPPSCLPGAGKTFKQFHDLSRHVKWRKRSSRCPYINHTKRALPELHKCPTRTREQNKQC